MHSLRPTQPIGQRFDVHGEIPGLARSALMIYSGDRAVLVEQRPARHALRELLSHFDQRDGALRGQRRYRSVSDVDLVARPEARKSERRRVIASLERTLRYIEVVVLGGGYFVRENG